MELTDKPEHHCGVAGIITKELANLPEKLFYPLYALQHRGQESAGITYTKAGPAGVGTRMVTYKDLGLVSQVLGRYLTESHPGRVGIGHVRYSTHGGNLIENVQPFQILCNKGELSLAHNGNISNLELLRGRLSAEGAIFQSSSDTEVILHLISRSRKDDFRGALQEALEQLEGAFSMVMLRGEQLIALRDRKGFRPLYVGWNHELTAVVSETCAFDLMGITEYREVEPGEILVISRGGEGPAAFESQRIGPTIRKAHCVFEFLYFARPDSEIFGRSVYAMRQAVGAKLAGIDPVQADLVMAVPDSGTTAALGYAKAKGLPFEIGMTRNHFAGRSFTLPSQAQREFAVKMKLNPIGEVVKGKRIVLVDDSLVRGTTSKHIVKLLRDAGAKEIHLRLSAPEIKFPCFYGIDVPTRGELISNTHDPASLAVWLGADTVAFLPLEELRECNDPKADDYCYACFSGIYPEPLDQGQKRQTEFAPKSADR